MKVDDPAAYGRVIRADGTVAVLINEKAENVTAWIELETQGEIEREIKRRETL